MAFAAASVGECGGGLPLKLHEAADLILFPAPTWARIVTPHFGVITVRGEGFLKA